ncbi:hypothetical protein BVX94_02180 [bacterium B17]|nr:hypothetical protein BVX94_02180 [bacterium B17]
MSRKFITIILIALAVLCIWNAGSQNEPLINKRTQYGLTPTEPLENAPPMMTFTTIVMGGFRGLIADILWLRISLLQEDGKFFELVQLSDWVTKLEPRNNEIWAFHAWNMAYNVSVMMPDYNDRWRWVSNGIKLLRDEGILYNRGDPEVYRQLGWLFQDKIAKASDMAHATYKKHWAEEMTALLGGPSPDYEKLSEAQRTSMKETYKLEVDVMKELDQLYGPLDWTMPEPHALYWAYLGILRSSRKDTRSCKMMMRQTVRAINDGGYVKSFEKSRQERKKK